MLDEQKIYSKAVDHSDEYLTTIALEDTTFSFNIYKSITTSQIESISYSLDDGKTWETTDNVDGKTADLVISTPLIEQGKHVLWKGICHTTGVSDIAASIATGSEITTTQYFSSFSSTGNFTVRGNIMSMTYEDNFSRESRLQYDGQFAGLFKGCSKLISCKDLFIGKGYANCSHTYALMFYNCTALTDIPEDIKDIEFNTNHVGQFRGMFRYCPLTNDIFETLPQLKNYTANYCYSLMFANTHISELPENLLPATTLSPYCYYGMFTHCSIASIPEDLLPATTLTEGCYQSLFAYNPITNSGLPEGLLHSTNLANACYKNMFEHCSSFTTIPEGLLPATTLAPNCYYQMFLGCANLTTIPEGLLPATDLTGADYCYSLMFAGYISGTTVSSNKITTIPEGLLPATTLAPYCYSQMFRNCRELITIPEGLLPATDLTGADHCYYAMFAGQLYNSNKNRLSNKVSIIPEGLLPATTLSVSCYQMMFYSCNSITTVPAGLLHAETVPDYGYAQLFDQSQYITSLPDHLFEATTVGSYAYLYAFSGCVRLNNLPQNLIDAVVVGTYAFQYMFNGCTALTSIPGNFFKVQQLNTQCYNRMFNGCTKLTTLPEDLFDSQTRKLAGSCYREMFYGCTGLQSIPKKLLKSKIIPDAAYMDMFNNCTGLKTICELPATRVESISNYRGMFINCRAINSVERISTNNIGKNACYDMFNRNSNAAASTTNGGNLIDVSNLLLHPANVVESSYYQFMYYFNKIEKLPNIRCSYTSGNVQWSFQSAFSGGTKCYNSSVNYAGFVPLTRIYNCGVRYMFRYDSGLLYIKHAATTVNNNNSADNWLQGVNNTKRDYIPAFIMRPTNSHSNINADTPSQWIVNQGLPVTTTVDGVETTTKYESVIFQKSYPADLAESVQIINSSAISNVQELKIDEVTQASVTQTYLFTPVMNPDTGAQVSTWHTVKLSLTDNTAIPDSLLAGVLFPRLILGYNVESIGSHAFEGNSELQFVLTGFKIHTIGDYAFKDCTNLFKIDLTDGLTENENGLISIGNYSFCNCTSLRSMILRNDLTTIGAHAFDGSALENIDIGNGLQSIGDYAFANCYEMQEIYVRTEDAPTLGQHVFPESDNEHTVEFTLTHIGCIRLKDNAWTNITGLAYVNLGWNSNDISTFGNNVFSGCTNIKEIFIDNPNPPTITASTFNGINNTFKIYVPDASVEAYKTAENWSVYADRIYGT